MAKTNGKLTRDKARSDVKMALNNLVNLQHALGDKKFKKRVKKAERLLSDGLPKKIKRAKEEAAEFTDIAQLKTSPEIHF